MSFLNIVATGVCAGSLGLYAVAARTLFVSPEGNPIRTKLIAAAFLVSGAAHVWILWDVPLDIAALTLGLFLYAAAVGVFRSACRANRDRHLSVAFTKDVPSHLVTFGPYAFVRHPYYASYLLTWLAGAIAARSMLLLAIFAGMVFLYAWAARFEEQKFAQSDLASQYSAYRANTGVFIPLLKMRIAARHVAATKAFVRLPGETVSTIRPSPIRASCSRP